MISRLTNEPYLPFVERCNQALAEGEIGYDEWGKLLVGESLYEQETIRRCSVFLKRFLDCLQADDEQGTDLSELAELYKKERMKLQDENRQYNANIRAEARNELFQDKIVAAIGRLQPLASKHIAVTPSVGAEAVLALSDFHAGANYEIKGLYGETVNKYSFNIMCDRLYRLTAMIEADDMVFDKLTITCLGDFVEGILRESSLTKLTEPVVDTVIRFSEFFANWLVDLQNRLEVPIEVVCVGGNHDCARWLSSKPMFEGENLAKYVVEFLKLRLKDCSAIKVDDYTDVAVKTIKGVNIMFEHGTDKDLKTTLDYFNNLYKIDCDIIFAGHLHGIEVKTDGIADVGDRMLIRVGSICGVDTYAKSIRVGSRPSCFIGLFTEDGLGWQKNYYL